jgi:DNA/RNA endonuclease YhcR with UshA esterase domain
MKKLILITLLLASSTFLFSQTSIKLSEVPDHVGDSVKLEGTIAGVKTFSSDDGKERPVLLNLGAEFPNQLLTVAVFSTYKTSTIMMPTESNKGDIAIVTGKIEMYKGKPQIVVREASQLQIANGSPVTAPKQQ